MDRGPAVVLGTAHLFGDVDTAMSRALLADAWEVGLRRFDTAPSYGGGRGEGEVGDFLRGRSDVEVIATKVGLAPALGARSGGRQLVSIARSVLPEAVTRRLKRASQARARGRFDPEVVAASLQESLRRLDRRIDRFLLHEVQPEEVTPELLVVLRGAQERGEVGAVGVATQNAVTPAVVAAGGGLFTVAQFAVGPLDPPVQLPPTVTTRVGHGLLGGAGGQLTALRERLSGDADLAGQWEAAVAGTGLDGPGGLARALLGRRPLGVDEVLVATTRPGRVKGTRDAVVAGPLPDDVVRVLDATVAAQRAAD